MKPNYKKILKLTTLVITSLLIATVSAEVYNNLFLTASVGVEGLNLVWDKTGIDSGVLADISGATCTLSGLNAPKGGSRTYSKAIGINATATTTFGIEVVSVTGDGTSNLDYIFIEIYDGSNNLKGNLTVWNEGAKGNTPVQNLSINANEAWRLEWHIAWKTTAAESDSVTVSLKVTTPSP
ncbi:hypothetical protein KEJ45_07125 [Candidatus Bathyarchaeota archaeon]|nr:hypothetical protein [Candidatus Bathyarchaeota archaeon]